ncbi:response regulator [Aminomonas paucivorans]|uniref:response regulator n=1 Tax=Aminomonas paucivorans TaxID=81412 RepID=UPI003322560F
MPWKVLVVEDEPLEREALAKFLREGPFEALEVRTAADALSFARTALAWEPQVVLLDIRIPGGDGLSTLEGLRDQGFGGKVLVLTAYDVFEYAQRALSLGVQSFLVKPVLPDTLYAALRKVLDQLDRQGEEEERHRELQTFVRDNRGLVAMAALTELVLERTDPEAFEGVFRELGLPPDRPCHLLGVATLEAFRPSRGLGTLRFLEAATRSFEGGLVIPWHRSSTLLLLPEDSSPQAEALAARLLEVLGENGIPGNVVFGGTVRTLEETRRAVQALEEGLDESLLGGTGRVLWAEEPQLLPEDRPPGQEQGWSALQGRVFEGFRNGDLAQMAAGRDELVRLLERACPDVELSKMLVLGLLGQVCELLLDLRCDLGAVKAWVRRQMLNILAPNNPAGLHSILVQALEGAWTIRASSQDEGAQVISQAMAFIRERYDEVTLEATARHVHVSASHLSRLFRKVLRCRFVDVVKETRMDRAKALLAGGSTVRDAALAVGYGNIAYFSTLFKQTCGVSPSEYARSPGA